MYDHLKLLGATGGGGTEKEKEKDLFWLLFKLHSLEIENNFHQGQSSTDLP